MKRKKGNISIVLLVSFVVLLAGTAIISIAVNSKFTAKAAYERIENRYIAESGIDLAVGLFLNYLSNQEYVLSYTKNEDGSYSLIDNYSPYLIDEIKQTENTDTVPINLVSTESKDYLSSIGFLDFQRESGIELSLSIFNNKDNFKLSRLCVEPDFVVSASFESSGRKSKINPIYLTAKSYYKGGEVLCNVEISDIYVVRQPFKKINVGEMSSITAYIDVTICNIAYDNYQNYKRGHLGE